MRYLHIFNPSHDEALAANSAYYYPANAARILEADLAVLPAWWAKEGDLVLLPKQVTSSPAGFEQRGIRFVYLSDAASWKHDVDAVAPWGWDALLVHQLRKAGLSERLLPDENQLAGIRQLSSRATSVEILKKVRHDLPETIGESFWCTSEEEVWKTVQKYPAMMLKAPWSSSGRGVFTATPNASENIRQRVVKILKLQGAVEAEPLYHRISDFAMEFYATQEKVVYKGISVFDTTETGAYTGNIVDTEEMLLQRLPLSIQEMLPEVTNSLERHLSETLVAHYEGPLGVDMMIVEKNEKNGKNKKEGNIALNPCVEINLRNTMGHVALNLHPLVPEEQFGIYSLRPVSQIGEDILQLTPMAKRMEAILAFKNKF